MKNILICFLFAIAWVSCQNGKPSEPAAADSDSVATKVVEEVGDSLPDPPKAADGLFDDFIYSYMRIPRFQRERTVFPLPNIVDGVNHPIERKDWKTDHLYMKQETYTMIFDNARSVKAEKDTSLHHVVAEWVYLNKKRVKQYVFDKLQGRWMLTSIQNHDFSQNINSDFYEFYRRFSSDKSFQKKHVCNPFKFKTYDYENFQNIEGLLDVEQWQDYRPTLPTGTITNINYGQNYGNAKRRVFIICSPSGGMGCLLTFVRKGNVWMLEKLEN